MMIKTKRILARYEPGLMNAELVLAEPEATVFVAKISALMPDFMHSAEVWLPNPFESHGPTIPVVMYHQAARNSDFKNDFGTSLLQKPSTRRIKGRNRTTAFGDIWLDFGLQDVAVVESITTKVNLNDPDEVNVFCSNVNTWFPGCKVEFSPNCKGTIDLHVFSPHAVPDENFVLAKMHWG